jgi:hypothetical protein
MFDLSHAVVGGAVKKIIGMPHRGEFSGLHRHVEGQHFHIDIAEPGFAGEKLGRPLRSKRQAYQQS